MERKTISVVVLFVYFVTWVHVQNKITSRAETGMLKRLRRKR